MIAGDIQRSAAPFLAYHREDSLAGLSAPKAMPRDLGLAVIIGGTNIRFVVLQNGSETPFHESISWQDVAKKLQLKSDPHGDYTIDKQQEVVCFTANQAKDFLERRGLQIERIRKLGVSVAGIVDDGFVTTVNTGVHFKRFPLAKALKDCIFADSEIPLNSVDDEIFNDGGAAAKGEATLSLGALRFTKNGIVIIIGTGVGGGGITDGRVDPTITEFGHTFFFNKETNQFSYEPFAELVKKKYFGESGYTKTAPNIDYAETRVAGPWVAASFVKKIISTEEGYLTTTLLEKLNAIRPAEMPKIKLADLVDIDALDPRERTSWATTIKSKTLGLVNQIVFSTTSDDLSDALYVKSSKIKYPLENVKSKEDAEFILKTIDHKISYFKRVGRFIEAVHKQWPEHKIVLAGGVCENLSKSTDADYALKFIRREAGLVTPEAKELLVFSQVTPEAREAEFVRVHEH